MSVCTVEPEGMVSVIGGLHGDAKGELRLSPEVVATLEEVQYNLKLKNNQNNVTDGMDKTDGCNDYREFDKMVAASEIFFKRLIKVVPESGIIEHRLGWDSTTGNPTTLTIVSRKYENKIIEIQELSSSCELDMIRERDYDCFFWVIADEELDRRLVDRDFPYVRTKKSHVHT